MSLIENIFWAGMVQEDLQPMNRGMCFHKQRSVFQSSKKWDKRKKKENGGGQMESKHPSPCPSLTFLLLPHILQHRKNI